MLIGFMFGVLLTMLRAFSRDRRAKDAAIISANLNATSANYNASLWAQSEQERMGAEIENASLRGQLDMSQKCYERMSEVAREAIQTGEVSLGIPVELRMRSDDSILDSDLLE